MHDRCPLPRGTKVVRMLKHMHVGIHDLQYGLMSFGSVFALCLLVECQRRPNMALTVRNT